ncbi:MAG: TldD/PmbA family protein [Chloroflexi bacterium]|nr:TldD/PmbA family protein [Chloroflexota bacterium]
MAETIKLEFLDRARSWVRSAVSEYARRLPYLTYCDVRVEVDESKGAVAENGQAKHSAEDYSFAFGVRVLAGKRAVAPGYYGRMLGAADGVGFEKVLREGIHHAYSRALASGQAKSESRPRFGSLGRSLYDTILAPIKVAQASVPAVYKVDPRSVPLAKVADMATEVSKAVSALSSQIVFNVVVAQTTLLRELFVSSEGADIDQSHASTEGFVLVVSRGETGNLELYDFHGHQRGWEIMEEGYRSASIQLLPFKEFALELARSTVDVSNAPSLPSSEGEVVVVTDPHFSALVCHEVVGHPSELDRALKMETAYAGRSWFLRTLEDHQIGKQVASPLVSAFSDPTIEGFGHYLYDHEGTPAQRAYHIEKGMFREFLNSRQTAALMNVAPNGSYQATDASLIPLIRMSNTAFAPGQSDPQSIIREVERGYYVQGHRIPSVSEARENFRISAMKVSEIRNGEVGQLYRDGAIMADSRDFFLRVDAAGKDFRLFPIPNCGKGQPMQAKRMSNGGPTMRSVARVTGGGQ